jgi:hypothetical protein
MSKAQFVLARELIKEKNYDGARALLVTVDHPLAAEWLAKLDRLAPTQADGAAGASASSDGDAFAADMLSIDDLLRLDAPASAASAAPPVAPKRPKAAKPEPAVLDYAAPVDAEVAPLSPNPIPAPASSSHAAFRRPGTTETPPSRPEMPEAPKIRNVQAKSASTANGKKTPAKAVPVKASASRAPAPATNAQGATAASVMALAQPAPKATWMDYANWLLLGRPLPGQEEKDRQHNRPPVDDRTPLGDDEAVDWRNLPSRLSGAQASDMPWLSGKIDARGSNDYGRVATITGAPAARGPAGDSLDWDFSGELPPPTTEAEYDEDERFRAEEDERVRARKGGHKLFDGLNMIFVGLFSFGVFAFIYTTRQAAMPEGETYTIGSEAAFVLFGLVLLVLGVWRIFRPEKTPASSA